MKKSYLLCFVICIALANKGWTQNAASSLTEVTGIYSLNNNTKEKKESLAQWKLELKSDETFTHHFQRQLKNQAQEDFYAQGAYTIEKLLITFHPTPENLKKNNRVDFNQTKARIHKKHPRNKSSKSQPVFIPFISSHTIALKGLKLYKDHV